MYNKQFVALPRFYWYFRMPILGCQKYYSQVQWVPLCYFWSLGIGHSGFFSDKFESIFPMPEGLESGVRRIKMDLSELFAKSVLIY